ncbi:MAG: hypothetical protein K2V38_16330, partial [Gemmataceae bacterium]|nr:hypothetical protein [Gemmataceae bacterium]
RGLLVLSSVGRQPNSKGRSSYDDLTLASFKESGDIEYAADDCFILTPPADGRSTLKHLKARHGEMCDVVLRTDLSVMRFTPDDTSPDAGGDLLAQAQKLFAGGKKKPPKEGQ